MEAQVKTWESIFPYEMPTKSQMVMMLNIIRAEPGSKIMVQNSTGGGKSIASMVGALTRLRHGQKIIIFCRTVSQISSFLREWKKILGEDRKRATGMIKRSACPKIVPMLGKAKMCRMIDHAPDIPPEAVGMLCHMIPCNLHPSRNELHTSAERSIVETNIKLWYSPSTDTFRNVLFKRQEQCPYYIQNSLLKTADIVVTTYPFMSSPLLDYLLDSMETTISDTIFIFDEAHNLAATEKVTLVTEEIEKLEDNFGMVLLLEKLKGIIGKRTKMMQKEEIAPDYVWEEAEQIIALRDEHFHTVEFAKLIAPETIKFRNFLRIQKIGYVMVTQNEVMAVRVAPNEWLRQFEGAEMQIYMSGTLRPLNIFQSLFGFRDKTIRLDLDANYDENQLKCFLRYDGLTSKMTRRGERMYEAMASVILRLHQHSPRHVLVAFPSYSLLNRVEKYISGRVGSTEIIKEEPKMKLSEIQRVVNYKREKVLILGVSSGKFTEGVELVHKGRSLISLLIFAGLPFRTPEEGKDEEMEVIKTLIGQYYGSTEVYRFIPILQAITQALGRTVRSAKDRGALVILDYRASVLQRKDPNFRIREYTDLPLLEEHIRGFFRGYETLEEVLQSARN